MRTVLCMASFFKGHRLLEAFKKHGCRTILVGTSRVRHDSWCQEQVDERFFVHDFTDTPNLLNAVGYLARDREIDLVVPLEEYSVETAGIVRAHLGCPGPSEGVTRRSRDKLAMRLTAKKAGLPIPAFEGFINRQRLSQFLQDVPPPWMVKPRMTGGAVQIRKLSTPDEVWKIFEGIGDRRSHHLIEAFVPSDVYHVDSIVSRGEVCLAVAGKYGTPPFDVWNGGGVFTSRTVPKKDPVLAQLLSLNERVIEAIGVREGVNHVEFLAREGKVYFLEIGARVAGSNLDRLTTAATGVDLFEESARIDLALLEEKPYKVPQSKHRAAGILLCLSRDKEPNQDFCQKHKEITWSLATDHHAGCVIASQNCARIDALLREIKGDLERDHLAIMPASDTPG